MFGTKSGFQKLLRVCVSIPFMGRRKCFPCMFCLQMCFRTYFCADGAFPISCCSAIQPFIFSGGMSLNNISHKWMQSVSNMILAESSALPGPFSLCLLQSTLYFKHMYITFEPILHWPPTPHVYVYTIHNAYMHIYKYISTLPWQQFFMYGNRKKNDTF